MGVVRSLSKNAMNGPIISALGNNTRDDLRHMNDSIVDTDTVDEVWISFGRFDV